MKILITGPISDFGGREIEVKLLSNVFLDNEVTILSTTTITDKSMALNGVSRLKSFQKELLKESHVYGLAFLLKLINANKHTIEYYLGNKYLKKIIPIRKKQERILREFIEKHDVVIFCGQLTSDFLKESVMFSKLYSKSFYLRITGTIHHIPMDFDEYIEGVHFIFHSKSNSKILLELYKKQDLKYSIIDQSVINENDLLDLKISKDHKKIRFGYLGRLEKEKGIKDLIKFFSKRQKSLNKLYVAGDGSLKNEIEWNKNIEYLGSIKNDNLASFFSEIDVLIIPSYEESGPLVALEALASGKIILTTSVGAMEERCLNQEGVFWFDIRNFESFDKSVNDILRMENDDFINSCLSNRWLYVNRFSFKQLECNYKKIIR